MPTHFKAYASNINRIRFAELIDYYDLQARIARAKPSLVANPLTGEPYTAVCSVETFASPGDATPRD